MKISTVFPFLFLIAATAVLFSSTDLRTEKQKYVQAKTELMEMTLADIFMAKLVAEPGCSYIKAKTKSGITKYHLDVLHTEYSHPKFEYYLPDGTRTVIGSMSAASICFEDAPGEHTVIVTCKGFEPDTLKVYVP